MKNKSLVLIYDDLCPLCTWYTGWFVKSGLLPAEGRKAFSSVKESILSRIDFERGKNEIPLIDLNTNQVWYGIDALLEILDQKIPCVKTIGLLWPIKWFLMKLYKLISFNRKVIVARKCGHGDIDCSPDLNTFYRVLFISLFLVGNTMMLFPVHELILSKLQYYRLGIWELQLAHIGLVVSNILLSISLPRKAALEFLGQVNMLAVITILMLLPLMLFQFTLTIPSWFTGIYLVILTIIIIREYFRRMQYAGTIRDFNYVSAINFVSLAFFLGFLFVDL
jgi:predicted DCC family thiol-disulfide oxidoreductase YuxK